jgi:hypothetical protein
VAYVVFRKTNIKKLERERVWRLHYVSFEPTPELNKRLVSAIKYLRELNLLEYYFKLPSEEILEKDN